MKLFPGFILFLLAHSAVGSPAECPLNGTWKSDAPRTLADIAARNALSDSAKTSLSDDFFGHMIHEWTCSGLTAWFDYQQRPEARPYMLMETTSDSVLVHFTDDSEPDLRLIIEGDCYKMQYESKGFYEYFCRVEAD